MTLPRGFRLACLNFSALNQQQDVPSSSEWSFFGDDTSSGDEYLLRLHHCIETAIQQHKPFPLVRFADGEFAFYRKSMNVNGLYTQASNESEIEAVLPYHIEALRHVAFFGRLCPITYLYSISWVTLKECLEFIGFLYHNRIDFVPGNYIPFYAVYAYLTSYTFMYLIADKNVCVVTDEFDAGAFEVWTAQFNVKVNYRFVQIPSSRIAVEWHLHRDDTLSKITNDTDLVLVAAGAGAGPVCADVALKFNIPAIDAGHVINLMNNKVQRSNGHRLYTYRGIYK